MGWVEIMAARLVAVGWVGLHGAGLSCSVHG